MDKQPKPKKHKRGISDYLIWGPLYYFAMTIGTLCLMPFLVLVAIIEFLKKE